MIYPKTFESKLGFDEVRALLRERCLSTLGKDMVDAVAAAAATDTEKFSVAEGVDTKLYVAYAPYTA